MMEYTRYVWVVWDLAAVGILVYFVGQSAYRGFVRTLISFMGYVVAAMVANLGSPYLAQKLYDLVVRDALRLVLLNRLDEFLSGGGAAAGDLIDALPKGLRRIMGGSALETADKALNSDAADVVESLIDAALMEPVLTILQGILFLVLFTLTLMVVRYIARMFSGVYKIPLIGTLNTLLGGVVGVLQSVLILFVGALILHLVIAFSGDGFVLLSDSVMDDTYVWRVFYNMTTF